MLASVPGLPRYAVLLASVNCARAGHVHRVSRPRTAAQLKRRNGEGLEPRLSLCCVVLCCLVCCLICCSSCIYCTCIYIHLLAIAHSLAPFPAVESTANGVAEVGRRGSLRRDPNQPVELRRRKKKKATKLQRQSTLVRHKVESLPSFTPWFVIVMSILQVVALIVLIATNRGVAPIRATPIRHTDEFPSLRANNSNATANVTYFEAVNLWIGLSPLELIQIGAKFTPCMRRDFGLQDRNTRLYGNNRDKLGCCKNRDHVGTVITTDECICTAFDGVCPVLTENITDGAENVTDRAFSLGGCTATFEESPLGLPSFHPCCVSITGLCLVTSNEECDTRGGQYHPTRDNCLEVNCLEGICGFNGANVGTDSATPYLATASQFWRFFLSIFIHLGVIHIIIIIPIQLYIGFKIERTIGWLRVGIIYLISGVGGNIVSL